MSINSTEFKTHLGEYLTEDMDMDLLEEITE